MEEGAFGMGFRMGRASVNPGGEWQNFGVVGTALTLAWRWGGRRAGPVPVGSKDCE